MYNTRDFIHPTFTALAVKTQKHIVYCK